MEIRVNIEDKFMQRLKELLKMKTPEIARAALTILSWAAEETHKGRVILSTNADGKDIHRLAMPTLEAIRPAEVISQSEKSGPEEVVHPPIPNEPEKPISQSEPDPQKLELTMGDADLAVRASAVRAINEFIRGEFRTKGTLPNVLIPEVWVASDQEWLKSYLKSLEHIDVLGFSSPREESESLARAQKAMEILKKLKDQQVSGSQS